MRKTPFMETKATSTSFRELIDSFDNGVRYKFIPYSFLNSYFSHTQSIKAYLLEHYVGQGQKYNEEIWKPVTENSNKNIATLKDDVIFLTQSTHNWFFFHYCMEYTECEIGRVEKRDFSKQSMFVWLEKHIEGLLIKNHEKEQRKRTKWPETDYERRVTGYREIPTRALLAFKKFSPK